MSITLKYAFNVSRAFAMLPLLFLLPHTAQATQFLSFDVPNSSSTVPTSINAKGQVVGYFCCGVDEHYQQGFVRQIDGSIGTFFEPVAESTFPQNINDRGTIVGWYEYMNNRAAFGFVYTPTNGFATIFYGPTNEVYGVNSSGTSAGWFQKQGSGAPSFVRDPSGTITIFNVPDSYDTVALAINDGGQVTGFYTPKGTNLTEAFIRNEDGTLVTFSVPGSNTALPWAINNSGSVTGYYYDSTNVGHGFVRDASGTITTFDAPNAGTTPTTGTFARSINDAGEITGYLETNARVVRGFTRDASGNLADLDYPGAVSTTPVKVNALGTITGSYNDSSGHTHGFLAKQSGDAQ